VLRIATCLIQNGAYFDLNLGHLPFVLGEQAFGLGIGTLRRRNLLMNVLFARVELMADRTLREVPKNSHQQNEYH
jgi:hypothetical protein